MVRIFLVLLVLDAVEEQRTKAMSYGMSLLRLRAARAARFEGRIVHEAENYRRAHDAATRSEKNLGSTGLLMVHAGHAGARRRVRPLRGREAAQQLHELPDATVVGA